MKRRLIELLERRMQETFTQGKGKGETENAYLNGQLDAFSEFRDLIEESWDEWTEAEEVEGIPSPKEVNALYVQAVKRERDGNSQGNSVAAMTASILLNVWHDYYAIQERLASVFRALPTGGLKAAFLESLEGSVSFGECVAENSGHLPKQSEATETAERLLKEQLRRLKDSGQLEG